MNLLALLKTKLSQRREKKTPDVKLSRRSLLKGSLGGAAVVAAASNTVTSKASAFSWDQFFQKHYRELTADEKKKVLERIENEISETYKRKVTVNDPQALENTKFVYALDLSKCNGNRRCVDACVKENNLDPSLSYIKVLELDRGGLNLEAGDRYFDRATVPAKDKIYMPVQCNQCDNPPCVKACPVEATWKEKDGIVVIDYDWCIGCRYCQVACPYEARHFNFKTPEIPADRLNPNQSYLSNRVRQKGVMEKCTFCLHRTRNGQYPACLEACPTGARKFGNILDPESEVSQILKTKVVFVLKEELNTIPSFYYYFG